MTNLATAIANLETHVAAVQISGTNLFHASDVRTTTGQVDISPSGALLALIRWTPREAGVGHPGEIEVYDVEIEVRWSRDPGADGGSILKDAYGDTGLAEIRAAIIEATEYLDGTSSPAITAYVRFDAPGRSPDSGGNNQHVFSLLYEAVLEV